MNPEQLRGAFEAQAAQVAFGPDPLEDIRTRIRRRSRRRFQLRVGWLGGAMTATVAAIVIGVVSCQPSLPAPLPPIGTTGPTVSTGPSPVPTTAPTNAVTVPVYWVGHQAGRPVLYREFRAASVAADTLDQRIAAAMRLALAEAPLDPDYATGWPAGVTVRGVEIAGAVATVDLAGIADPPPTGAGVADPATAQAAVQQLVWTATAVAADRGTPVTGVRLRVDGADRPTLWGVPVAGQLTRADSTQTLAAMWLITPQQGAAVATTFTAQLDGSVFEAAARLRVRDASGQVVSDQPVLLSIGTPNRGQAAVTLTLPAGHYTVEAYTVSQKDGSEQALDGHQITVG